MTVKEFARTYLQGNEDAQAYPEEGLFQLADQAGYKRHTDEWNAYVDGGSAFRFMGHTFEVKSESI